MSLFGLRPLCVCSKPKRLRLKEADRELDSQREFTEVTKTNILVLASLLAIGGLAATQARAKSDDDSRGEVFSMVNAAVDKQITTYSFYTLSTGIGSIGIFSVQEDGSLENLGSLEGLPAKAGLNEIASF